jgi:hypothetical protein
MKYMNHLRKLALLSSLALSFTVFADGTLPLPGVEGVKVILKGTVLMEAPVTEAANPTLEVAIDYLTNTPSAGNSLCDRGATFWEAEGTVNFGNRTFSLAGVCVPKGGSSSLESGAVPRVVVGTDGVETVRLSGTVSYNSNRMTSFSGTLVVDGESNGLKFTLAPWRLN